MNKQALVAEVAPSARSSPSRQRKRPGYSTAAALLKHVGTWVGDDAQELLRELHPGVIPWKGKKVKARRTKKAGPRGNRPGRPRAAAPASKGEPARRPPKAEPEPGFSTARSLLKYAGTWVGNDLKRRLKELHASRSRLEI